MELIKPVNGIGYKEVFYLVPAVIEDKGSPFNMFALSYVFIFVKSSTVKTGKAVAVFREMGGDPVQNDSDIIFMAGIYKIFKVLWCSITACRGKITRNLVTPRTVIGMLHNRKKLQMSIPHSLGIRDQSVGKLPVGIRLEACFRMRIVIGFLLPGA
jgi:hypothetical protein